MQKKKLISIAIALTLQSYYIPAIAAENNDVWGSDQFWAELVQPGRTSKPCVARGVVI